MPVQYTMPPDTRAFGTADPALDADALIRAANALGAGFTVLNAAFAGGADPTGVADSTAAINAADVAATATGGIVLFPPGTYKVTGVTKQADTIWQGAGRYNTTILLANGSNADVIQGANFSTLTLTGSTGGIPGWGIRDMTIDGNKANQSGTSNGIRVYGYDFDLTNVSIMNCHDDGLYTEWSASSSVPGTNDDSMECRLVGVKIHDNNGHGWHNRGPHDSRAHDLTIFLNGSSSYGFWVEAQGGRTVAAGSNGVDVSTFAGAGVLNVSTTMGYPTASTSPTQGGLSVITSGTTAVITYTGVTATSFTGCTTVSGNGTLTTGNAVTAVGGGYSGTAPLLTSAHVFGNHVYGFLLDVQAHLTGCMAEGSSTANVLVRAGDSSIIGGNYFPAGGAGCGIQVGDTANGCSGLLTNTKLVGFAGTSAANAAVNFVNDAGSNAIDVHTYTPTGTAFFGSPSQSTRCRIHAPGGTIANIAAISFVQDTAAVRHFVPPASATAWHVTAGGGSDIVNINSTNSRVEVNNAYELRVYSDSFTTPAIRMLGASGHIGFAPPVSHAPAIAADAGNGGSPPTPTLLGASTDVNGQAQFGSGTSPTTGQQVAVTFGTAFTATPIIILTPANDATSVLIPYVSGAGTGSFHIAFHTAPTASQAASTYLVNWVAIARPS